MGIAVALLLGLAVGVPVGWGMKTRYLRMLHKTAKRIRIIQIGGRTHRRHR